ncbi:hypothetical protein MHU86_21660 [Fragilaria crotonensis]|nr:hypothetical protein MHU86_21660 [Fragilaria crotonensis]
MSMYLTTLLVKFWSGHWARSASADNYSYNPVGGLSCAKNVDALINSVCNGKKLLPFVQRVDVDHGSPSDVICFDFASQLLSLLQNPSIMTAENLAIDMDNVVLEPDAHHPTMRTLILDQNQIGWDQSFMGGFSKEEWCWHQRQHFYHTVPMMTLLDKA